MAPGFLNTDMTQSLDNYREEIKRRSALRQLAEVGDVASLVEYLLGDKAKALLEPSSPPALEAPLNDADQMRTSRFIMPS